ERLEFLDQLDIGERYSNRSQSSDSFGDFETAPISFSSASDSIFTTPAFLEEKAEVAQVIQQMIKASTREMLGERYYAEVDKLWIQDHEAWINRSVAQSELNGKKARWQQAEELLAKVTEARALIDAQKTLLGRISKYSAKAAVPLSFIPGPVPCGGIAHTVSEVTDKLNQIWVNKDVVLAKQAVTHATEEVEQATQKAEAIHGTAMALRRQVQEAEQRARLLERAAQKDDVERLRPPVTSFDEEAWRNWATAIVQAGKGNPDAISILANHGMSDPLWAMTIVDDALVQKNVEDIQTEEEQQRMRMAPFEEAFQSISKALQEAEKITHQAEVEVTKARQRLESATQIHAHWKSELETINEAFNELEKPENMRKPSSAHALERKKEEFCAALTHFEEACNDLKPCEEELAKAYEFLATKDAKAAPLRNEAVAAEQRLQRAQERAAVHQEKQGSGQNSQVVLRLPKTGDTGDLTVQKITQHLEKLDAKNKAIIIPPEVLDKTYETIGKALLKAQQKAQSITCLERSKTAATTSEGTLGSTNNQSSSNCAYSNKFQLPSPTAAAVSPTSTILLPEIREPSLSDLVRWEAAHHTEDFMEEKDHVITQIKERSAASQSTEKTGNKTVKSQGKTQELRSIQEEEEGGGDSVFDQDHSLSLLRMRFQSSQRRTTRNSATSVRSKSIDSKNSIGSFLTSKTGVSKSGSVTGSIPVSVSSVASKSEMKGLKAAMRAINEAATRWAEHVRKADAERVAAGGVLYPDEESLFDAWQRADAMAEAAWKKRCAFQEEALRAAKMASTWEEDAVRWEVRAEADRLAADEKEAEADLVALAEQQKPLDPSWRAQNNAASLHLEQMQKVAKAAQQKWFHLAELEESVKIAQSPQEKKNALTRLQEKDQAVMTLWEEVREDYYKEQEIETRRAQKERLAQEGGAYKFDLLTQKSEFIAECFNSSFANEEAAVTRYSEATMREALRSARERIPGAEAAWELRVSKALKDCKEAQAAADAVSSFSEKEGKAHGLQKTAARLTAIVEADRKALEALKEEAGRLGNIEKVWRTQLAVEEKAPAIKRLTAARLWEQGDPSAWNVLSHREREAYNEAVIAANEALTDSAVSRLQEAQENTQEWSRKATKAWRVFSKKSTEQIAEQIKSALTQIKQEEDERRVAIRVSKLHDFSNKAKEEEALLHTTLPIEANNPPRALALGIHNIAEIAMRDAKDFCDDLGISWARKAPAVRAGFRQAAHYAKRANEAWNQVAEAKRTLLAQIPLEPVLENSEFQKSIEAATVDLISAEKGKYAWVEKRIQAKKNALEALNPKTLQAKAAFEEVRIAWETMRYYPVPEVAAPMAVLIKAQTTAIIGSNSQLQSSLLALSSVADALADLSIAARNHSRIRTGSVPGTTLSGGIIYGGVCVSSTVSSSVIALFLTGIFTGGSGMVPIALIGGGYLLYRHYHPVPLAPHTTEVARTAIRTAQETTETAVHATSETIWAADTAWCCDAVHEAEEFVMAITGAETAEEVKETGEAEAKAEKK
ncbi:MAG TPA: hypothetical protein VJK54_09940, partial [Chthoniobacterales bacterium]|nr:hypothetical protein [Chthoniobacterales bacterium]